MLPFMREQRYGQDDDDSSVKQPPNGPDEMPAEVGQNAGQAEYLTVAANQRDVRKSTILLGVFFAIGILCLWLMIRNSTPQTATASQHAAIKAKEAQVEMAISRLTGVRAEMFRGIERIVKKFYEFSDTPQVGVDELARNPFRTEGTIGNIKEILGQETFEIDPQIIRQEQLKQQAEKMQLLSIMQTDTGNCCMVDNKLLQEGDSIKGFNVRRITDSYVRLESQGVEVILKLSK